MEHLNPIWKFLNGSPVVLLVLGFVLTTLVGGLLTERWQSRAKEWELKTSLVTRMTEEVMNILMAVQLAEVGAKSQTQEDFDAAYKRWEIQQGVIGSTIRAYFPEANLGKTWDEFAEQVSWFYALTGTTDENYRTETVNRLKTYIGQDAADWDSLVHKEWRRSDDIDLRVKYGKSWSAVKSAMTERNGEIQRNVFKSRLITTR